MNRLDEAGYRSGAARREVVTLLAGADCALTALEIGGDAAGYERVDPDQHHHHLVCEECGKLAPFSSPALEKAIAAISQRSDFSVSAHDVVLRRTCAPRTGAQDAARRDADGVPRRPRDLRRRRDRAAA